MRVLGYLRVSTAEQALSGLGVDDQRAAIAAEAKRRRWTVEWVEDLGYSAKDLNRPGIANALARLADGDADGLVVAKLDRLSRSLVDFAGLMDRSRREGWTLVALDLGVDTSTPSGEMVANVMAAVAQWERRVIGERTRNALAQAKSRGVRLGGPIRTPDEVRQRIAADRAQGRSLRGIAKALNRDGVPTARGGAQWHASTVAGVLRSVELDTEAAARRAAAGRGDRMPLADDETAERGADGGLDPGFGVDAASPSEPSRRRERSVTSST